MHATQHFSQLAKTSSEVLVLFQQPTYVKAVSQLAWTSKLRPGIYKSSMMTCKQAAILNEEPCYSIIIEKKTAKKLYLCLIVGVLCKFIVSLYSLRWNHVTVNYLISDKGYEKIWWKVRGYECILRLITAAVDRVFINAWSPNLTFWIPYAWSHKLLSNAAGCEAPGLTGHK